MRKRLIEPVRKDVALPDENWLDLEAITTVEVSSEDPGSPIENALLLREGKGWLAAEPGQQTIRLIFDIPQHLRRIWLCFEDSRNQRTQEYVLRWYPDRAMSHRDIVRQQWAFSPQGSTTETESHTVELSDVKVLELIITPDIAGESLNASLQALRVA